ncbi:hypothetical protein FSP39_015462, partial [Pinctada imbricata]
QLFLWREKFERLRKYSANQNQYLIISYKTGKVEHRKGPCIMYLNPVEHLSIREVSMTSLDANEALVVYKQDQETKAVERYVQFGPTMFMPLANEWLHNFSWHGTDPSNKTQMIPGSNNFDKLQIIPGQFYYNVDEVRTADDAPLRVKLMLFYELKDIETMLNATKDPMADFINCMCADVVAFASKYTYIEFMERSSELNDMANYPQLMERSKKIGFEVSKVVYRGYHAHEALQKLHDTSIQTRTNLKIAFEVQVHNYCLELKDLSGLEQKMEVEGLIHMQSMEKSQKQHKLGMELLDEQKKIERLTSDKKAELKAKVLEDTQKLEMYTQLSQWNVDLNTYLKSKVHYPEKVVRIVADKDAANFHLHHS